MLDLSGDVPTITMRTSGGRRALGGPVRCRGSAAPQKAEKTWLPRCNGVGRSREPTTRSTPRIPRGDAATAAIPAASSPAATSGKDVTHGPVLVFVAGVEGTGHHMLCAALTPRHPHCRAEPCFKVDKRLDALVRQCPNAPMHHACANAPMHHYADVSMRQRRHAPSSSLRAARCATLARRCSNGCAATTSH